MLTTTDPDAFPNDTGIQRRPRFANTIRECRRRLTIYRRQVNNDWIG